MYFERYVAKLLPGDQPVAKWGILDCKKDEYLVDPEPGVYGEDVFTSFIHKEAAEYEAKKRNAGLTMKDI